MSATLDVLGDRFGVSRDEISTTEIRLKALGLTTVQSREAIRDFTRSGASQAEVVTLVGVAMDAAARQGLTLEDALSRLQRATFKAEPELIEELGIRLKLIEVYRDHAKAIGEANANSLTTEQRARAIVEALTKQADAGGEFAEQADNVAGALLRISTAEDRVQEGLSDLFNGPVINGAELYESALFALKSSSRD